MKPETLAPPRPEQVLGCWKDIANYLHRDVRTVQRWEQSRGLPVHRLPGHGRNAVYALTSEIDSWWDGVLPEPGKLSAVALPPRGAHRASAMWAGVAAVAVLGIAGWMVAKPAAPALPLIPEFLTSLPGAEMYPSLSPDGKRLLFTWCPPAQDHFNLYMMALPAGRPEQLTRGPGLHWFAEWSPDESRLAYVRMIVGSTHFEIRLVDAVTREDRLLSSEPLPAVAPPAWALAWSRRGDALILSTPVQDNQALGLSLLEIASGKRTRLTTPDGAELWDMLPAPSPDGSSLVFLRRKIAGDGNLFRQDLNPDGSPDGPPRQITHEDCCVDSPSWSADGREIVFLSTRGGTARLMRVDARGGDARHEPAIARPGSAPRVAANGWLVSWDVLPSNRILEVPLRDGVAAGPARELIVSSRTDGSPAFSPDGRQIVFRSDRSGTGQLWVFSRADGAAAQLTSLEALDPHYPAWSPGNKWIAFEGHTGATTAAYVVDTATRKHWRVSPEGVTARLPRWSRSGRSLYVASDRTGRNETWRIDLDARGKPERMAQLTAHGGFSGVESADGRFVYYSNEMTLKSLWRVPATGGKEEQVLQQFAFNRYPTNLAAGADGLYSRGQGGDPGERGQPIWMAPFNGGAPRRVMIEPGTPSPSGIAVSPDGRALLLSGLSFQAGDVLAYRNFR